MNEVFHIQIENLETLGRRCNLASGGENIELNRNNCENAENRTNLAPLNLEKVKIIPNPATNMINVDAGSGHVTKVTFSSLDGSLNKDLVTAGVNIDVTELPQGIYIVYIYTSDGDVQSQKFIKIK